MPYALITALLLAAADTTDSATQASVARPVPWWEAYASTSKETFAGGAAIRLPWYLQTLGVRRRGKQLSFDVAGFVSQRFAIRDHGAVGEATRVLWSGAYGSARVHGAPGARAIAQLDVALDLYQDIGAGWEAATGARAMHFRDADVSVYSAGIAKYVGDWYLRGRASVAPMRGEVGVGTAFTARRYFGSPTELIELSIGAGREVVSLEPPQVALRQTTSATLRAQHSLTEWLGATGALSLSRDEDIPERRGFAVGVFARW